MIFIYIHCVRHDDTQKFCSETLCTESVTNFLNDNFITWIGNVSNPDAYQLSHTLGVTTFPFISVLAPHARQLAVVFRHTGLLSSDALIAAMVHMMDQHQSVIQQIKQKTQSDNLSRQLIQQQDREYKEALERDRKQLQYQREEEKKAAEEKEKKRKERDEQLKLVAKIEAEKKAKEDERTKKRESLPPEPPSSNASASVCIRLPNGTKVNRRFLQDTKMKVIFDFIESNDLSSNGEEIGRYQIVSNYPRRVHSNPDVDLKSLGLGRQCLLFVEEVLDEEKNNVAKNDDLSTDALGNQNE